MKLFKQLCSFLLKVTRKLFFFNHSLEVHVSVADQVIALPRFQKQSAGTGGVEPSSTTAHSLFDIN
jgi:hypothetical protein